MWGRLGEGSGVQLALRQESDDEDDDEDDDGLQHQAASLPIAPLPKQPKTGEDKNCTAIVCCKPREAGKIACGSHARRCPQAAGLSCHLLAAPQLDTSQVFKQRPGFIVRGDRKREPQLDAAVWIHAI